MPEDPRLASLGRLVGKWATEATHRLMPDVIVHGTTDIAWLEGKHFLIIRAHTDHKDFPDAITIIGDTEHDRADGGTGKIAEPAQLHALRAHYFDERGVFRNCETSFDGVTWRVSYLSKGFSQRFQGTLKDDDTVIEGLWQLCEDDVNWMDDLRITYRLRLPI